MSNDEKERERHEAEERVYALLKPTLTCPVCATTFSWVERRFVINMKCPGCQTRLRVPSGYFQVINVLDIGIVAAVSYIERMNVLVFLLLIAITYVPIIGLLAWLGSNVCPPRLRVDEDARPT